MIVRHVNLIYLSDNRVGGWIAFTGHLFHALKAAGLRPQLYRTVAKAESSIPRDFCDTGIPIYRVTEPTLRRLVTERHTIITSVQNRYLGLCKELMNAGAWLVINGGQELKKPDFRAQLATSRRLIVIRRALQRAIPHAVFIPHPYVPKYGVGLPSYKYYAINTSRVSFIKNTHWILDANRMLPPEKQVVLFGFEDRIYTKFSIMATNPEWEQSAKYRTFTGWHAGTNLCRQARFMVDMTAITGEGGGTQYTFLEAWDAGAVCILNAGWFHDERGNPLPNPDVLPDVHCLTAPDKFTLASFLYNPPPNGRLDELRHAGRELMRTRHNPVGVGKQYVALLDAAPS